MKIPQWSNTRKGKQAIQDAGHAPKFGAGYLQRCQKPQQRTAFSTLEGSRVSSLSPHPYCAVHFQAVAILCRTYDHRGNKLAHFRCHTALATSVNTVAISIRPFTNPARRTHCFWTGKNTQCLGDNKMELFFQLKFQAPNLLSLTQNKVKEHGYKRFVEILNGCR